MIELIQIYAEGQWVPVLRVNGEEVMRGNYQDTAMCALAKCADYLKDYRKKLGE